MFVYVILPPRAQALNSKLSGYTLPKIFCDNVKPLVIGGYDIRGFSQKSLAVALPRPDDAPVIKMVFIVMTRKMRD
ncbi:MAG: hypothetical protein BGO59_17850 [Spirosoma sp. 48-14]|nr:MAG: hypothetical protein BGO59_17850 [Spirosoma sp. 48-14]